MNEHVRLLHQAVNRWLAAHPAAAWCEDEIRGDAALAYMRACKAHDPQRGRLSTLVYKAVWRQCDRTYRAWRRRDAADRDATRRDGYEVSMHLDAVDELQGVVQRMTPTGRALVARYLAGERLTRSQQTYLAHCINDVVLRGE